MKIEWFVQYYYSAEDVYKAKKMQWLLVILSFIWNVGYIILRKMIQIDFNVWNKLWWCSWILINQGIWIWLFWGYEKSKIAYRKSMNECKKHVSETMAQYWHTYDRSELTWKRDKWITIPQVGLMFIFMVLAILSIVRV